MVAKAVQVAHLLSVPVNAGNQDWACNRRDVLWQRPSICIPSPGPFHPPRPARVAAPALYLSLKFEKLHHLQHQQHFLAFAPRAVGRCWPWWANRAHKPPRITAITLPPAPVVLAVVRSAVQNVFSGAFGLLTWGVDWDQVIQGARDETMRTMFAIAMLLLVFLPPANAAESRIITGRVVDAKGSPVAGAAIDFFWSANGPVLDQDGKPIDLSTDEALRLHWSRLGQMWPYHKTKSETDGRFSIEVPNNFHTLLAIDVDRVRGGLAVIAKDYDGSDVHIRLEQLIRVKGTLRGSETGQLPYESTVEMRLPDDPTRPLDVGRIAVCFTHEGRFLLSMPPGRYFLNAYDFPPNPPNGELHKEIVLSRDTPEIDLGLLNLSAAKLNINDKIKQSQDSGTLGDYTKHYGEKVPAWHIVDARGINKSAQLSDFKGKWVLLDFWALNCSVCLKHDLPKLVKFYDDHKTQREQFEILAICVDCNGEIKTVAEVDRALQPIVKYVWGGKPLPFPVLLDPSMTTLERYGVPGYETILIDPEGRLVEGDETVLAKKLTQ